MKVRTIFAFLVAPISFGLITLMLWGPENLGLVSLGLSAVIGYPLALIIGVPSYCIMQKLGANGLISYSIMASVFAGILISMLIIYPVYSENNGDLSTLLLLERIWQMLFLTVASFFTMLVFWLIARPNQA